MSTYDFPHLEMRYSKKIGRRKTRNRKRRRRRRRKSRKRRRRRRTARKKIGTVLPKVSGGLLHA